MSVEIEFVHKWGINRMRTLINWLGKYTQLYILQVTDNINAQINTSVQPI